MPDPEGSGAGSGPADMDIDATKQELAIVKEQLAVTKQELAATREVLPKGAMKQPETFSGKGRVKFADFKTSFEAFQTALHTPRHAWGTVLLTFLAHDATTYLRAKFSAQLGEVPYEQLVDALEAYQWGRIVTESTLREALYNMRLKRGKGGRLALPQLVHDFDAKLLECKTPLDAATACWLFTHTLPAGLRSRVATDAAGQPWTSLEALRAYTMAVADAWESESASLAAPCADPTNRPRPPKKPRFGGGAPERTETPKPVPPDHSGKPSFVPGRTPQEVNALRKRGACFNCGKPGHKAAQCKAPASKST